MSGRSHILKIDVDIKMDDALTDLWIATRKRIAEFLGFRIVDVRYRYTRHGMHFWIYLDKHLDAHTRAMLQFMMGDDHRRCFHNFIRLRLNAFDQFNALFGVKVYEHRG